jgi:hypothetical protein
VRHEAKTTRVDPASFLLLLLGLLLCLFLGFLQLGFLFFDEAVVAFFVELLVLGGDLFLAVGRLASAAGSVGGLLVFWLVALTLRFDARENDFVFGLGLRFRLGVDLELDLDGLFLDG